MADVASRASTFLFLLPKRSGGRRVGAATVTVELLYRMAGSYPIAVVLPAMSIWGKGRGSMCSGQPGIKCFVDSGLVGEIGEVGRERRRVTRTQCEPELVDDLHSGKHEYIGVVSERAGEEDGRDVSTLASKPYLASIVRASRSRTRL